MDMNKENEEELQQFYEQQILDYYAAMNDPFFGVPINEIKIINEALGRRIIDFASTALFDSSQKEKENNAHVLAILLLRAASGKFEELLESFNDTDDYYIGANVGLINRLEQVGMSELFSSPKFKFAKLVSDYKKVTQCFLAIHQYGAAKFLNGYLVDLKQGRYKKKKLVHPVSVSIAFNTSISYHDADTWLDIERDEASLPDDFSDDYKPVSKHSAVRFRANTCTNGVIEPLDVHKATFGANGQPFFVRGQDRFMPASATTKQIHLIGTLQDNVTGFPVSYVIAKREDVPQPLTCTHMAQQLFSQVFNQILFSFRSIKYLVGDENFCTAETIDLVRQFKIDLIAQLPDSCQELQDLLAQYPQFKDQLQPLDLDAKTKANIDCSQNATIYSYVQSVELYGKPVKLFFIFAPERKTSIDSFWPKVYKEQQDLNKKLSAKFTSQKDFVAMVSQLQAKAKYCRIVVQDPNIAAAIKVAMAQTEADVATTAKVAKTAKAAKGRKTKAKAATSEPTTPFVKPAVTVEISTKQMEQTLSSPCCYVLVCTNVDASASEVFHQYVCLKSHPSLWECFPNQDFVFSAKYLREQPECCDGILAYMSVVDILYKQHAIIEAP